MQIANRFGITLTVLLAGLMSAPAMAVDWGGGLAFHGAGSLTNPGLIVGFNPQPEPPAGFTELDLSDPTTIRIAIGADPGAHFLLYLGFYSGEEGSPYAFDAGGDPNESGEFGFMAFSAAGELGAELQLVSSSGGVPAPGTWQGFNPQPEPPAFGLLGDGQALGFEFDMTSLSDVTLTIRLLEQANGEYINFTQVANPVPLPAGLFLMPTALLAMHRLRRKSPAAQRLIRA